MSDERGWIGTPTDDANRPPFGLERKPLDRRNRWKKGRIRHLRLTDECPIDGVYVILACEREGQADGMDVLYTLVVHPQHAKQVEEYRRNLELRVGGPFSPDPDV